MRRSALVMLSIPWCVLAAAIPPAGAHNAPKHKAKHNLVTVRTSGGDYADPIAAAANAFQGDRWCTSPQPPAHPCVIDIGSGIFILQKTLTLPSGLLVRGAAVDETRLVAARGVRAAVDVLEGTLTDLTIINRQPGSAEAIGVEQQSDQEGSFTLRLRRVAIHTEGATTNTSLVGYWNMDIADADLSAEGGQAAWAVQHLDLGNLTARRSQFTAGGATSSNVALLQEYDDVPGIQVKLHDSHLRAEGPNAVAIRDNSEESSLEVRGGDLTAVTGTGIGEALNAIDEGINVLFTGTRIVGDISAWFSVQSVLDGVSMQGGLGVSESTYTVLRSQISGGVGASWAQLMVESSFVGGVSSLDEAAVTVTSSVVTGNVTTDSRSTVTCDHVLDGNYVERPPDCASVPL